MFVNNSNASSRRLKEAENARKNRLEIVRAHSTGELSRRDMFKLGIFTSMDKMIGPDFEKGLSRLESYVAG